MGTGAQEPGGRDWARHGEDAGKDGECKPRWEVWTFLSGNVKPLQTPERENDLIQDFKKASW